MRKIVLNLALSLDGFIRGPNGEYDWCFTDADYGMTEFIKSIDSTIMGKNPIGGFSIMDRPILN